ncbi:hypothetical protein O181_059329 [Austropuccinia psidii MF-1]|uniref:Uncharacterized protein n=1 Tax=Austropuccinia psidii MF-1 TaxID=1389203 RepID=A0A9Q3EE29_9BASI|nr:hypothetical protein [Austropuccinia psidii MF-1]
MVSSNSSYSGSDVCIEDDFGSEEGDTEIKGYPLEALIEKIRKRLNKVIVPKDVSHIPSRLGTAQTGKLKVNEWSCMFEVYLPLAILNIFWDLGTNHCLLLVNVGACSVNSRDGDMFSQEYEKYQQTSNLFFTDIQITPNHHFAMHIPERIKQWGPLNDISEYGGERLVGILQKLKTNFLNVRFSIFSFLSSDNLTIIMYGLSGSVEETIMKRFGQLQRLEQQGPDTDFIPSNKSPSSNLNRKELDQASYSKLLNHLQKEQPDLRHYGEIPHPPNARVLRNYVVELTHLSWNYGMKVSKDSPNNLV